uniref:Uncharacterized protein n=1 Tax=Physcomitrium patens TaxID=3218 RepID=A0A2K1J2V9_PHYPA|nr:hypothetical protein PHYPA_021718 [Physcomitrium patens]
MIIPILDRLFVRSEFLVLVKARQNFEVNFMDKYSVPYRSCITLLLAFKVPDWVDSMMGTIS